MYDQTKYLRMKAAADLSGTCVCGRESAPDRKLCVACLDYQKSAYQKRKEHRKANRLCIRCNAKIEEGFDSVSSCMKCSEKHRITVNEDFKEFKKAAMWEYGNSCQCCGEENLDFLAIDHIGGGGTKHRKEEGVGTGSHFYVWLKHQGYPKGYRVLCHNCNFSVHLNKGTCAHTLEENQIIEGEPIWPYDPIKQVFAGISEYS